MQSTGGKWWLPFRERECNHYWEKLWSRERKGMANNTNTGEVTESVLTTLTKPGYLGGFLIMIL